MTGKARVLLTGLFLSMAGGCTSGPVFSVEVLRTPTPFETGSDPFTAAPYAGMDTPAAAASQAAPVATLPAFTQAPAAMSVDFTPILYGKRYDANTFFILLGGVQSGRWLTPEQAASLINGTSEYDIHTSALDMFQVLGYAPESMPIRPGQFTIGSDSTRDAFGMLGVAHGWPVRQGQVDALSPENELYKQAVLDWLKEAGLPDPQPGVMHIFRVDLEGDGADEIFFSATRLDDSQHVTRSGDYSIVLMRKVVGNEAVTLPLAADIYRSTQAGTTYPRTYLLANFIDINQDGILEVVVDYQQWEQDGAMIYTIQGPKIIQVP